MAASEHSHTKVRGHTAKGTQTILNSPPKRKQQQTMPTTTPHRKLTNLDLECMEYDAVSTITLVSGWDSNASNTLKFQCAVSTVMKLNPVLTGKLLKSSSGVQVETGVFDVSDVFQVIQFSLNTSFSMPVSAAEKLKVLQQLASEFNPKIKTGTTLLKNKSNIFEVGLMVLPSGCACYKVSISHAIADASTYYKVMQQLSDIWNGREPNTVLDWTPIPEVYPFKRPISEISLLDKLKVSSSLVFLVFQEWLLKKWRGERTARCMVVNKSVCKREKVEANDGRCKFLSTNDVVTAALVVESTADNLLMAADLRGKQSQHPNLSRHTAGNYVKGFFFSGVSSVTGGKPSMIRKKLLDKQSWCNNSSQHFLLFGQKFCLVTNWVSFMTCVEGKGLDVVGHMPSMSAKAPFDCAIIFKFDHSKSIAVRHNIRHIGQQAFCQSKGLFEVVQN